MTSSPNYAHRLGVICVPRFWSECIPCGGTLASEFLRLHGATWVPTHVARFGHVPLSNGGTSPAVVFAYRRDFDEAPIALEIILLTPAGRLAATQEFSYMVGDTRGTALMTCPQRSRINIVVGGLDALAMCSGEAKHRCYWAVDSHASLPFIPLSQMKGHWQIRLLSALPPTPQIARIWRRLGAWVTWEALHQAFDLKAS